MTKFAAALAFAALLAAGSAAQAAIPDYFKNFSGYVRGAWTRSTYSYTPATWDSYNPWDGWSADGALNWHLPNDTDLELEGRRWIASSGDYDVYDELAALHWSKKDGQFRYGAFGGWMSNSTYYDYTRDQRSFGGLEGQYYLRDDVTLYGQAGITNTNWSYYLKPKPVKFFGLTGRYFWRDDTKVELGGSFFHSNREGDSTDEQLNVWDYNAEIEHHFTGTPFGVFAGYDWWDHNDGFNAYGGDHTWKVGVKFSFGTSSLRDEDRKGATLKVVDFSPIPWLKLAGW